MRRAALSYFGGKWLARRWIIGHLPARRCYCEPFGGAASVLLAMDPSEVEVYNDLDGDVVNFFRVLREQPDELVRMIRLTPYSRAEYRRAYEPGGDQVERARRLYVRSWQGFSAPKTIYRSGWRFERSGVKRWSVAAWQDPSHLYDVATRLRRVQIECDDALNVIRRFDMPDTLFYVDPPYVPWTRQEQTNLGAYRLDYDEDDHVALAETLHHVHGMVVVSGYLSELYGRLYADWRMESRRVNGKVEGLWIRD